MQRKLDYKSEIFEKLETVAILQENREVQRIAFVI